MLILRSNSESGLYYTFLENYHQELSQKENETIEMELEEIDKEL